jgi:hypothetical protein
MQQRVGGAIRAAVALVLAIGCGVITICHSQLGYSFMAAVASGFMAVGLIISATAALVLARSPEAR